MQQSIWGFYSRIDLSTIESYQITLFSKDFTQILGLSTILDVKDSTESLSCRASGGKLVFLTIFVSNCHLHVNKRHTFLVAFQ